MAGNSKLRQADGAKYDEFYTQLSDIEDEMRYYKEQFKGKTVLCNCDDDPFKSNFFKYFAKNFNYLGLKKLITTSYDNPPTANIRLSFTDNDKTVPNESRRYLSVTKKYFFCFLRDTLRLSNPQLRRRYGRQPP